jgi:hypothetical protein
VGGQDCICRQFQEQLVVADVIDRRKKDVPVVEEELFVICDVRRCDERKSLFGMITRNVSAI